jgi:hypothetical protein
MLVYGDHAQTADPRERVCGLAAQLAAIAAMPPSLDRHSALVGALIDAGALLQGVADAEFEESGEDRWTPASDALTGFAQALGGAVCSSWSNGFAPLGALPAVPELGALPDSVELRTAEGFAFYAVYPEAYAEAARSLTLSAPARVIGIRSIGTVLAAIAAAALDAPQPVTLRPFGDPFARRIAVAPELERELLDGTAHYLIVDEGPGQSGSSFGAVADWLEERGVEPDRIAFLPSHSGPLGTHASERHRRRWSAAQRAPADSGVDVPARVAELVAAAAGARDEPLQDISAGRWRSLRSGHWPAVVGPWERRKFLARRGDDRLLIKFAGLGSLAERKLAMARALHAVRLSPEPVAAAHGFVVERWHEDAVALAANDPPVREIASYIGARARLFPADGGCGATVAQLLEMSRRNIALALGEEKARLLDPWERDMDVLARRMVRVATDNRLDPHEWLRLRDGRLLKTDALDHHYSHDLVGSQDVAWDVAGALAEWTLEGAESAELIIAIEIASGRTVDRQLLDFYRIAYSAFRLGQASLGAEMCGGDAAERHRLTAARDRYSGQLAALLPQPAAVDTRPDSLVG